MNSLGKLRVILILKKYKIQIDNYVSSLQKMEELSCIIHTVWKPTYKSWNLFHILVLHIEGKNDFKRFMKLKLIFKIFELSHC